MDLLLSDLASESSGCEDQDNEFMYGGQASCILSSLEETIGKIDDFLSFERGFIHGDIVRSITDPSGQMGRVINVDMIVSLENVHGNKVKEVNSKKLQKIRSISLGDYVVNGPWIGKVEKIVDCVTILFDEGTKCEFNTMGPEKLVPISPDLLEDSQYPYYPGQRVKIELSTISKSAIWFCGTQREKQDEGTVCSVDAGLVHVDWLGCALVGCKRMPAPPCLQDSKNLALLSCFSHANWQLGDWCILPITDHRGVMEQKFLNAFTCGHKQSEKDVQRRSFGPSFQEIFVIVKTKIKVDVIWQDSSQSLGLDSHSLFPVNVVDAHDFWPDQFVLEKGTCDDPHVPDIKRWGVVKYVDAKERTVRVEWKTRVLNQATHFEGKPMEETLSAYELFEHPDYSYCLGDAVFSLQKGQFVDLANEKTGENHVIWKACTNVEAADKSKECDGEQDEYLSKSYLSRIGIVVGFKDGDVEVKWATGLTTKVVPYEIFPIDKSERLSATPAHHDENVEFNEETTDHDNQSLGQEQKDLLNFNGDGDNCQKSSCDSCSSFLPRAAIGFFTSIAASLVATLGYTSLSVADHVSEDGPRSEIRNDEEVLELCNLCTDGPPVVVGDLQTLAKADLEQKVKETQDIKDLPFSPVNDYTEQFRQFDMVRDCSGHHFVDGSGKGLTSSQVKRDWLKKVQKEWSILEKDLPQTIYVRVYEERMDLLRAAIVGAPGTPYHDGLFFFDICLPPEYPHRPPLLHYNSGGLRVNPNLYESGKVCLSLLNTWTGTGSEVWNPGNSTILQVLLSLQALVLNEKPYFNEAGFDKQVGRAEGEKNSVSYNENAFLVSCKSMLYLLRKPPKHFEAFVEEHFSRRCKHILMACKAYMEGVPVGCALGKENAEQENQKGNSTGFKIMLAKLFPKLAEAFSDMGIDCDEYIEPGK